MRHSCVSLYLCSVNRWFFGRSSSPVESSFRDHSFCCTLASSLKPMSSLDLLCGSGGGSSVAENWSEYNWHLLPCACKAMSANILVMKEEASFALISDNTIWTGAALDDVPKFSLMVGLDSVTQFERYRCPFKIASTICSDKVSSTLSDDFGPAMRSISLASQVLVHHRPSCPVSPRRTTQASETVERSTKRSTPW